MSVKKFYATADTTITNAYKENIKQRGTGANMGLADSLEIFFIYGQTANQNATEQEKLEESRILLKFDTEEIKSYYEQSFPSGVKFILKLTNAVHPFTLARNYGIKVYALAEDFVEGNGVDMDSYSDVGVSNWTERKVATSWTSPGGLTGNETLLGTQNIDTGEEDLEIDITSYIQSVFDNGTIDNGFAVIMDENITGGAQTQNFYTKKFFARSSQYFFKRPVIEARDSRTNSDDRGRLFKSSPLVSDNIQKLYLYNSSKGVRSDITGVVGLELFENELMTTPIQAGIVVQKTSTGVYEASLTIPSSVQVTTIYEKWTTTFGDPLETITIKEGNVKISERTPESDAGIIEYVTDITNLKTSYTRQETAKFRIYTRQKDWNPTIYTVASKEIENLVVEKAYYKIVRLVDEETVLDYGIGTEGANNEHTLVSYDALGSYFDFDMSLLEKGYMYGIKIMFSVNGELREQKEIFKFRVD